MTALRAAAFLLLSLVCLGLLSIQAPAQAAVPATSESVPVPANKPSLLTPIAAQLDQLLNGNKAAAATTSAAPAGNAALTTTTSTAPEEAAAEQPEETFGTRALSLVLTFTDLLATQAAVFADNFADLPQADDWLNRQLTDARIRGHWIDAGQDLVLVGGLSFAAAFLFELVLLPARRLLRHRQPVDVIHRLTTALILLAVELLPVVLFVVLSLTLLNVYEAQRLPRFVVLNVIYAITLHRLVLLLGQFLLAPRAPALRLVPGTQMQAQFLYRWLNYFGFVLVYGYFCVDLAHSVHVPAPAVNAFGSLLGLALVAMTITVILQKRAFVAVLLRGNLSAAQRDLGLAQSFRLWLARSWHIVAIAYLVIGYLVTALDVQGGFAILLRGTVLTFLVFVATGLALHAIARATEKHKETQSTPQLHHAVLLFFLRFAIWLAALAAAATAWGASITSFLATPLGQRVSGGLFSIGITVVVLALIYGYVSTTIERHLNRQDKDGRPIQASARMRTLLPMLRNAAFMAFIIIACLVILSEAGFNIGPLLAGAGVIGVAVGFGSQTLVKDFLTGLFIVIENTVAIGDVVKIGDHSGVVEAMSVRTLRIRDGDGAVHILPFSEVSQIVNMTKDFAYALVNIGVAYNTDIRKAMDVIKQAGDELRQDSKFKSSILDPTEVFGIDKLADSAIVLQARIRTRPGRQWDVKRMFLLMIKERFEAENIEIPYPTVTQITKNSGTEAKPDITLPVPKKPPKQP